MAWITPAMLTRTMRRADLAADVLAGSRPRGCTRWCASAIATDVSACRTGARPADSSRLRRRPRQDIRSRKSRRRSTKRSPATDGPTADDRARPGPDRSAVHVPPGVGRRVRQVRSLNAYNVLVGDPDFFGRIRSLSAGDGRFDAVRSETPGQLAARCSASCRAIASRWRYRLSPARVS